MSSELMRQTEDLKFYKPYHKQTQFTGDIVALRDRHLPHAKM